MFSTVEWWQIDGCVSFTVAFSQVTDILVLISAIHSFLFRCSDDFVSLSVNKILSSCHRSFSIVLARFLADNMFFEFVMITSVFSNILLSHEGGQTNH